MDRARDMLRSGAWLTRERIRLVAVAILFASGVGFLFLVVTANGLVDTQGRPLGTDFSSFYAAGTYVLDGNPEAPFDLARQYAREQAIFGAATPFYGWLYPPFFLFIAAVLALMPYGAGACGVAGRHARPLSAGDLGDPRSRPAAFRAGLAPPRADLRTISFGSSLALAFPAVLINVGHGQNGFLTAASLAARSLMLDRQPLLAGILFGLLAYKPQFGLMIPIVLAASGRWRTFRAAAATVALLVVATTLAFGLEVWPAFLDFDPLHAPRRARTGRPRLVQDAERLRLGAHVGRADPARLRAAGRADCGARRRVAPAVAQRRTSYPLKAAALCLAAILATPFTLDYDMMVLAPAIAFFAADGLTRGFGPWEKTALAALWLMPLVARSVAQMTLIPLAFRRCSRCSFCCCDAAHFISPRRWLFPARF